MVARPVPACTCRRLLCGGALWGTRAKHASRHGRALAFGLYVNRGAGILSGRVGARPVPACTCRRLLCGGALWDARAKNAARHGRGLAFGLYLNRGAGILSGGVGARLVLACTCRRLLCGSVLWDARAQHAARHGRGLAFGVVSESWCRHSSGGVQGQYRPVRAGVSCAAARYGMHVLRTQRDMVAD
jgi:hypothetical protein